MNQDKVELYKAFLKLVEGNSKYWDQLCLEYSNSNWAIVGIMAISIIAICIAAIKFNLDTTIILKLNKDADDYTGIASMCVIIPAIITLFLLLISGKLISEAVSPSLHLTKELLR